MRPGVCVPAPGVGLVLFSSVCVFGSGCIRPAVFASFHVCLCRRTMGVSSDSRRQEEKRTNFLHTLEFIKTCRSVFIPNKKLPGKCYFILFLTKLLISMCPWSLGSFLINIEASAYIKPLDSDKITNNIITVNNAVCATANRNLTYHLTSFEEKTLCTKMYYLFKHSEYKKSFSHTFNLVTK